MRTLNAALDRWLTAPETNAAGRMALFRILFGLFYLWILAGQYMVEIAGIPAQTWHSLLAVRYLAAPPGEVILLLLEAVLIASLFLLIAGYCTRAATLLVLVTGVILGLLRYSFGKIDHSDAFLMGHLPALFLFGRWGHLYSLDALLARRRGASVVQPHESSWRYIWPQRVTLFLLTLLFPASAFAKLRGGVWLTNPDLLPDLIRYHDLRMVIEGRTPLPINGLILQTPALHSLFHILPLLFEGLFFLALFSRPLRNFFLASAVLFHTFNFLVLNVPFTEMLIVYALFVDWQALYDRLIPASWRRADPLRHVLTAALVAGALLLALLAGLAWNNTLWLRAIFHAIPFWAAWLIGVAVAVVVLVKAGVEIALGILNGQKQ